jgi:hypothetical protein
MKVKLTFTFNAVVDIPDILVEKAEGGIPKVVTELAEEMRTSMALKYGKEVEVTAEVIDG